MRIGIDLGGTKIEAVALDQDGIERARQRVATPRHDYEGTLLALASLVASIEATVGRATTVGVGMPGTMSTATGLVKNANSTWLIGRPFQADLEHVLGRAIRIANDANCFALSEAVDGAGAGGEVVFGVILGTGTGGGLVVRRRVWPGLNGIAGEWGHNPLPWPLDDERPGPACYCRKRGCIETFLSGPGLSADHQRCGGAALSAERIHRDAQQGDHAALASLDRYAERLARALASVINIVDPDVIVLGGGLSHLSGLYEAVPRLWGRHVFSDQVETRLVAPRHGDASGVRGAAWLWEHPER